MSSESEDDMTTKILSNANLTKRDSGYILPGRSVSLTTIELLYVVVVGDEEIDTTLKVTAEIRDGELRVYRLEGLPEAVEEFVSPQGMESTSGCSVGASDYQNEIVRQIVEALVEKDSVSECEAEDLEVKFLCP